MQNAGLQVEANFAQRPLREDHSRQPGGIRFDAIPQAEGGLAGIVTKIHLDLPSLLGEPFDKPVRVQSEQRFAGQQGINPKRLRGGLQGQRQAVVLLHGGTLRGNH